MSDAPPPLRSSPPPAAAGNEAEPAIAEKAAAEPSALAGLSANELLLRGNFRKVRAPTSFLLSLLFFCASVCARLAVAQAAQREQWRRGPPELGASLLTARMRVS